MFSLQKGFCLLLLHVLALLVRRHVLQLASIRSSLPPNLVCETSERGAWNPLDKTSWLTTPTLGHLVQTPYSSYSDFDPSVAPFVLSSLEPPESPSSS